MCIVITGNALTTENLVSKRFIDAGIQIISLESRQYPGETIFVVKVENNDFEQAALIGNSIDSELGAMGVEGFVTVRKSATNTIDTSRLKRGVADKRATQFVNLVVSRARTSDIQPSLSYIADLSKNITTVTAPRHQLIFGRRGAGKTALMVEAKRVLEADSNLSIWVNLQTHRHQSSPQVFLSVAQKVCEVVQIYYRDKDRAPNVLIQANMLLADIDNLTAKESLTRNGLNNIIPRMQVLLRRFTETTSTRIYIFLDDLHYLVRSEQAIFLDMVHGIIRDCDAWLKIASIRHLTRWFQPEEHLGLQTGHDADLIDLDVSLENPKQAKEFLEKVLQSYATHAGISSLKSLLSAEALDRLVLASGAVPRDYLVLSAAAVRQAQKRERAKLVGVEDVNRAAGEAAKTKINELEDDAASKEGAPHIILNSLALVRNFCLEEKKFTYFRIDFFDKEKCPLEYGTMQDLMDLRLIHLISASLSDEHKAGCKSEVFMLDLSQFSGHRFKKHLRALDFESGHIVARDTGARNPNKVVGDTPRNRLGLLRRGPLFELGQLAVSPVITS